MICEPCRDAADLEGITIKDRELLHDRCVNRDTFGGNEVRKDCACQHRVEPKHEHYLRGKKWFTNLGDVDMCNCGNRWPCEKAIQIEPIQKG